MPYSVALVDCAANPFLHYFLLVSDAAESGLESEAVCTLENIPLHVKLARSGVMVRGNVLG